MVFGVGCQRERLFKLLCIVQAFVLAGTVCYYFQGSVEKTAPDHDIAGDTSQPIGETLRPVWGPMDKCYPVTAQGRRVKSGKKQAPEQAATPKVRVGLSDAAPKEEPGVLSQDAGEVRSPAEEAASPIPAGKEVAEEEEVAGMPGCEGNKAVPEEAAVHPAEASEVERKADRLGGTTQPLKKLWLSWFPAPDSPKAQTHEPQTVQ